MGVQYAAQNAAPLLRGLDVSRVMLGRGEGEGARMVRGGGKRAGRTRGSYIGAASDGLLLGKKWAPPSLLLLLLLPSLR